MAQDSHPSQAVVYYISPDIPFLEALSQYLLDLSKENPLALASYCILLPTQRSLRTLKYLLETTSNSSFFLPKFFTLNDLSLQAEDFLTTICDGITSQDLDALTLPLPLSSLRAHLLCTEVLKHAPSLFATSLNPSQLFEFSNSLLKVLGEILSHPTPIQILDKFLPSTFAAHWEKISDFLKKLLHLWPEILKDENASDPGIYSQTRLKILEKILSRTPLKSPLLVAGIRGLSPHMTPFLKTISRSSKSILLFDSFSSEFLSHSPTEITPLHPLYEQITLLKTLQIPLKTLKPWPFSRNTSPTCSPSRLSLTNHTFFLNSPSHSPLSDFSKSCDGISFFEANSLLEEARLIALQMRHVLETPNKTAALVTPDRTLALLVKTELLRWGIIVDDSAGIPFSSTSCGSYFLLTLKVILSNYAPLRLIALLKHPFTRMGRTLDDLENAIKILELYALRGLKINSSGLQNFEERLTHAYTGASPQLHEDLKQASVLLSDLKKICAPLEKLLKEGARPLTLLKCHEEMLLNLSRSEHGLPLVWEKEEEKEASLLFQKMCQEVENLPFLSPSFYLPFLENIFKNTPFQLETVAHPRLAILGLFESRLLTRDTLILGSLNEGTWPDLPAVNPWLNRRLMEALDLPNPDVRIGIALQDFVHCLLKKEVLLTRSKRDFEGINRPSRILIYLKSFLESKGLTLPSSSLEPLLKHLETSFPLKESTPPKPSPALQSRPHTFSVSEVEMWIKDPYGFYARKILNLKPLRSFEERPSSADFGNLVHNLLEKCSRLSLQSILTLEKEFEASSFFKALSEGEKFFWKMRLSDLLERFMMDNKERSSIKNLSEIEVKFELLLEGVSSTPFVLRGRIDRLEVTDTYLHVIDYKTGNLPKFDAIDKGVSPQLPLLGMMLKYGKNLHLSGQEIFLSYWPLKKQKGIKYSPLVSLKNPDLLIDITLKRFKNLLQLFYEQNLPAPYEAKAYTLSPYAHLARVKEWAGPMEALEFSEPDLND